MSTRRYLLDAERRKVISEITKNFWDECGPRLSDYKERLKAKIIRKRAKELLDMSYDILDRIVERLNEPRYVEKEEEYEHHEITINLWDAFAILFDSFIVENAIETDEENIDLICNCFFRYMNYLKYQRMATRGIQIPNAANAFFTYDMGGKDNFETWKKIRKKLRDRRELVREGYSQTTHIINRLYILERHKRERPHKPKPKDPLTDERSFGNMHTLHGLLLLSGYAFLEILEAWLKSY